MAVLDSNTLPYVPPGAPVDKQIEAINRIIDLLNAFQKSMMFSDGANKRMIIGYQKDGWGTGKDFGIKISKPGVDVQTAADTDLLFKMDVETWFWYDPSTGKNYMQVGIMPDSSGGFAVAKTGSEVADIFS